MAGLGAIGFSLTRARAALSDCFPSSDDMATSPRPRVAAAKEVPAGEELGLLFKGVHIGTLLVSLKKFNIRD